MEATIKWTYPSNDIKIACANPMVPVNLMVRSSKAVYDDGGITDEQPVVIIMKGYPKTHPGGTYKKQEDTEVENTFSIFYYKEEVNGEAIVELDVMNGIYKVGGEDLTAERRQNLGI